MAKQKTTPKEEDKKWNNKLPDWLNVAFVIIIFITLCIGAKIFLLDFNHTTGEHNYESFFPSGLFTAFYLIILFIVNLFATPDLANIVMVILLFGGISLLGIGFFSKSIDNKSTAFEFAAAILGLALGIPFGEKLRNSPLHKYEK
jgi:hypothetical protein